MAVKKPIVKRAPRTPKEKAFATEYIANGGNGTAAALKTYDVKNAKVASTLATENLSKLSIREHFENIQGLRMSDRLLKLYEGMNADKETITGDMKPDFTNRYKFLELTFKLDGSLKNEDAAGPTTNYFQFVSEQKNNYGV